jgi:hypothetical protein
MKVVGVLRKKYVFLKGLGFFSVLFFFNKIAYNVDFQ